LVAIFDWLQSSIATLHNFVVLATPSLLRWQGVDNNVVQRGNPAQLCCSKGAAALAIVFTFSLRSQPGVALPAKQAGS
jgi:hypothetical protein